MNYYVRTQQVLAANAAQTQQRLAGMHALRMGRGLRGLGQSTAGLPAGSQLTYSATFQIGAGPTGEPLSLTSVVQAMKSVLSNNFGIQVVGAPYLGPNADALLTNQRQLNMTVLTQSDRNSSDDVKSILDGLVYQLGSSTVSVSSLSSSINLINPGVVAPTSPPVIDPNTGLPVGQPQPFDLTQFLTDNWPYLVAGGAALLLFNEVL